MIADLPPELPELYKHEIRAGWLDVPEAFHPIDFLGAAMGSYFIWHGATGKGPQWATIGLGTIMVWIHLQRFFYAPQGQTGLIRLLKAVDVKREDICPHL